MYTRAPGSDPAAEGVPVAGYDDFMTTDHVVLHLPMCECREYHRPLITVNTPSVVRTCVGLGPFACGRVSSSYSLLRGGATAVSRLRCCSSEERFRLIVSASHSNWYTLRNHAVFVWYVKMERFPFKCIYIRSEVPVGRVLASVCSVYI